MQHSKTDTGTLILRDQLFLSAVRKGLRSSPQKTLPSRYFYDAKGSSLFQQIMALPEYYLTRAEMDIFRNKTAALISALNMKPQLHYDLVELGPGDGTKTIHLLEGLLDNGYRFDYLPVDISQSALNGLTAMLQKELPGLNVVPQQGDYFAKLKALNLHHRPKVVLILGSNIGNLLDAEVSEFIDQLGASLSPGDKILLGVDLVKAKEIVLPAYSDAQGITAEFNLNLLDRINRELGADFNRRQFEHRATYEASEGIAKSYLISQVRQSVRIGSEVFHFTAGESIHTEISRKYNDEIINGILQPTNISVAAKITDSQNLFADYVLVKSGRAN